MWKWGLTSLLPATHPYKNAPFLTLTETVPRSIPSNAFVVPVNTYSTIKTLTLPNISTNVGKMLIFKDYLGYAGSNAIRLSTTGLDNIENVNVRSMVLSNAYGAWSFMNDGINKWFLTNAYLNSLVIVSAATVSIVTTGLINNVDAATYTSGSTWTALVGNNQTLFGSGTTTTTTPGGSNAIVFNGSGYGLDTTGYASSSIASFTMDLWFYAAANVTGSIVGELGQASQGGWNVTMISISGNTMYVGFWQGSVYQLNCGTYTANTWNHISYTYSGTSVIGYVNGVQVATGASTKQWPGTAYYGVASAANPYSNFVGRIGAYKLYSRALTATEVRQNYNALASRFGRSTI